MKRASIHAAVILALAAPLPSLAGNVSLSVEGIAGSFEILAFNFGAKNPVTVGSGGGAGTGKVTFSEFSFTATESAASPSLFEYVAQGKHSPGARLSVLNPDNGAPASEWLLTDVIVTSFGVQNGDALAKAKVPNTFATPVTGFGLSFGKACYRVFAGDGSVAKESCWNLVANTTS